MSSEFDTAVTNVINNETTAPDKAQAAREGYVGAVDTNPDEYAEMQRVARRVGVPTNVAMDMPQEVKKQASIGSINFDTLAQTNPATASLLADTNKAKIAHDDVPNLQATERSLNGDIIERMQRGYAQGRSGLIGGTIEPMQRGYAQGRSGLTLMLHSMGLFKGLEEQKRAAAESNGISYDPTVETATMMAQRQREVEKYPIPEDIQNGMNEISKAPDFASAFESALSNPRAVLETTLQSLGTSFPALATTAGGSIFGPVGTAAGAGMGSFAVEYGSTLQDVLTDKGMDPNNAMDIHRIINDPDIMDAARDKAIKRGIPVAIFDAITAGVAGKLLAGAKATPLSVATRVGGELALQAGGGAAGEAAAQAATGEFKPGDIIMEAIAELPTGLVEIPGNYKDSLDKAQRSEDNTRFVETLNDLSNASKVLQRDPETFEAFVNRAAENGPVEHVYIDASTLMQSGVADQLAAVSPSVAEQLPLAQSTGGQISIPIGEYASRIAPTEYAQALVDHIKTSPDEFSRAEAADFMQNHQEELQKEIERSLGNAQLNDEFKQSTSRLKEKFQTELDAVGHHTTDVNKAYATLLGDYFAVNAAKMGMSPEELHNQYALRFASELQQGYDQSRVDMHFKDVTKRIEGLTIAANDLKEGKISREDYDKLVNELKPVTPYATTPEPSSTEAMQTSLTSDKVPKIGRAASILHTGDRVGLRLDIPAYQRHGTWVVSIHSARSSDKGGVAGTAIGYDSVAAVTDARFGISEKAGLNIAAGKTKATIATVEGKWAPITPKEAHAKVTEALQDPEWVQVGMDPERHSYFYDRKSMEPVVSADEVVQIGPLVMAKNPVYAPKDHFLYQSNLQTDTPAFKKWFGDSKVVDAEGKPLVVYHGTDKDISMFSNAELGKSSTVSYLGAFFTPSIKIANLFTKNDFSKPKSRTKAGANIVPVYLRMDNPVYADVSQMSRLGFTWRDMAKFKYAASGEIPQQVHMVSVYSGKLNGKTTVFTEKEIDSFKKSFDEEFKKYPSYFEDNGITSPFKHDGVIVKSWKEEFPTDPLPKDFIDTEERQYVVFDPAQIKSATGNNGKFDPNDANIYHQFAGVQAWTADTHALTNAIERIKKGENPEQVRKETGWHTGADGVWRFEISDDKAKFNTPFDDWTADRIREEIQVQPNPDEITGLYRAIFREGTPDHFGSRGRSEEEAINNVVRNVRKKYFADEGFDINKVSDGDTFVLSHVLSHSDLFDAYPSLLNTRVHFEENTHAYNGKFSPDTDVISLAITGDEKQMLSTLLHEIQHAIQEKEGFGLGGNTSKYFTDAVKTALGDLSKQHEEKIAEWTNANFDKMVDHRVAAKVARYGLMYESAQRLIGYANRSEPSGVFRLIRQEMQWIYSGEFSKNDKAQDLQRDFYNIPKRHKKNERNAFIGDMAFRAGRVLLDEIGPMYQGQFKNDPRTLKGMLKALEREADKKRQALTPLHDLENEARMAENVKRAHSFSSPYDVYQSLAGEVEARNTQARQGMTPEERRNTSPKQSADVPVDKIIVRFGGLEIRAPMASIAEQATYNQGTSTNRGSFNPTNLTISLLKKADLTTFLHETGHFFLEMQMDLAAKLEHEAGLFGIENLKPGEQSIIKDANTLLDWFGVQDLDTWHRMSLDEKRGFHEQTARGFEVYLFEGNAPSIELQPVFQRFKGWLKRVYKSIEALNVVLTDDVRGVFDRMLASDEQIQLAQQARSMMPLFATLDAAPMSADEFREYQNLQQDATASAVDELDARGLRDMKWLRNARSKVLKAMQKDAKEKRREVRAEARIEVLSQPIYRAWALLTAKINPEDRLPKPTVTKSNPNVVTPEIDSLFAAVAKLGGLNKSELMSSWDLDPAYKPYSGVFGKPTWRKDGGLSIDSMLEALTPYGYLTLDHHGKPEDSREFEELFDRELRGDPQYSFERDYNRDQEQRAGSHIVNPYALNAVRFDKGELLAAIISDEDLTKLQAYKMVSKGDGMHQDIVADLILDENGNAEFTSGDDLIQYLLAATPPNEEIEALTDLRMLEKYGDLSSPGAIEKAADKAIHNDLRARLVATEANALAKATGGKKILASAAKMLAATTIARKKIRDLIPSLYTNAEVKAAKSAEKYMRAKDLVNAAAEKRNQLFNMFAAKAAMDARDEVDKGLRYLKKFNGNIKGIDADYADQIAAILSRFDLRKISNKEMDRRKTLDKWLTAQEEEGLVPDLPEHITNEAFIKPYKELSVEEFRGVIDSVKQIEHLGRLKKKLLLAKDQREFDAIRDEIVQSINDNSQGRIANTRTINTGVEQAKKKWGAFAWGHAKVATLAKVLDGGNIGGPVWEFLIRPANERGDWETTQRAEATLALSQILAPVFNLGKMGGKGLTFQTVDRSFNREARIAIALNVGNEGNLQRLLGGEGWSLEQIMPILKTLTREEWTAVQAIWDHFETYRPLIAAKERRVYGKEPNWVEPTPFIVALADGETVSLRGGYYPIKYDPAASQRAEEHSDAEAAKRQIQGAYTSATTRRSFTKARAEEVKGRPLLYSLSGVYAGVNDVIHDLAWHEWLIDTNRLIKNNAIDTAIRQHYGPEFKSQFKTWTSAIAEGEKGSDNTVDIALSRIRQGVSVSGLGFNVMSAAMQPTGITQSISVVGANWVGLGVSRYLADIGGSTRNVNELSEFMANRARTRFRELNELRNSVEDQSPYKEWLGRYAYFLMMRCQQMVDVPTWIGAYEKAQAEGVTDDKAIALADQAVIDSQGSGMLKDLSAIERGGAAQKLFTVFYSYMNTALNVGISKTMSAEIGKRKAKLAADYLLLYVLPPVLGFAIKEALTPTGDDDDDYWEKLPKRLASNQIDYLMGLMVVVREFSEAAKLMTGVEDHKQDYQGPAGVRMIADSVKFGEQLGQGEFDTPFRKSFVNLMGDAFALPSAQINRTVTGIEAISEGKTSNPAAIAFGFKEHH